MPAAKTSCAAMERSWKANARDARSAQEALAAIRREHDAARGEVENLRVEQVGLEHDANHLGTEHVEHFGEPLPEIPGELPPNLAEMEVDLARVKEQIEAIGPVNVLAADEYGSEEERHKFLSVQRADVAASVESLRQTIREINQTSSARFKEAFAPGERAVLAHLRRAVPRRRGRDAPPR